MKFEDVMKKLLLFVLFIITVNISAQQNVAVTTKAQGYISLKRATATEYKPGLQIGTPIQNQDWILTGTDGFGVLVFIDDKSQLKIRSNTELEVQGDAEKQSEALTKRVHVNGGQLKVEITNQEQGEFSVISPTSIAAVKGTEFWFNSDSLTGDVITVLSGIVQLTNRISGDTLLLEVNQSGRSTSEGELQEIENIKLGGEVQSFQAGEGLTLTDVNVISGDPPSSVTGVSVLEVVLNSFTALETTEPEVGDNITVIGYLDETGTFTAQTIDIATELHKLEFEFEDSSGQRKKLEIEYR